MATVSESQRHIQKLKDPDTWPLWPVLPVKRHRDGGLEVGYVTADYPHIVLRQAPTTQGVLLQLRFECTDEELGELGMFDPRILIPADARPLYDEQVLHRFQDVEALVDNGWEVG